MVVNQLAKQIIWWQEEDDKLFSIRKKAKDRQQEQRTIQNRYYLLPDNTDIYFTYREMEIAMYLFEPITYKTIGQIMSLSDRTVECHVRRMRIKLGCKDRFELIERIVDMKAVVEFKAYFEKNKIKQLPLTDE